MATAAPVVLVVEDGPQMRRFLRTSLSAHGYRVIEAGTAREALILARGHRPDLILLDLGLPGLSGLDVARALSQSPDLHHTRLIALSGWSHDEARQKSLEAGFDDFLVKPVAIETLQQLLDLKP